MSADLLPQRRFRMGVGAVTLALFLLAARLVHLQACSAAAFRAVALRQQISHEEIPARPGDIVDRNGRLLATTLSVPSLFINPSRIEDPESFARTLADALCLDPFALAQQIERHRQKQFLWIKRRLTDGELANVRALQLSPDIAGIRREFQRFYPQGPLAGHVLGLRDIDNHGRGGVEEVFDAQIRGQDGTRRFVRDASGYVLDVLEEVTTPPENGTTLQLTLDIVMQSRVEAELDRVMERHRPRGACAIVLDPRTGETLALASRPAFNPLHPELADPADWKNLAVSAVFEPGSTFKPLVVGWALDAGMLDRDEQLDCERGAYRMGPRVLHDHHRYGMLSVTDVLVKSSNIGMAKIGERLGNDHLFELASRFGCGRPTGIELPGELPGLLRPRAAWNGYSTGSIPMGQELAATPLQIAAAHAALANGGVWITPHVLLRMSGPRAIPGSTVVTRVISWETAQWLVAGPMKEVVERGTGTAAKLPDISVFGKTGTAQKAAAGGYSSSRHVSSFVCGAPAEDPRLIVLVTVDEPTGAEQYGGSVAAPAAAAILSEGLRIFGGD